jgi:hypothetical protein
MMSCLLKTGIRYCAMAACVVVCVCILRNNAQLLTKPETHWSGQFDFDGDGVNDRVMYEFTGGAHCCYLVSVFLSSDAVLHEFPFEMDGGYEGGLDLSKPGHFSIKDYDEDGLPEIFMEINTYNDEIFEIPSEWTEAYGITSNYILIDYKNEKLVVNYYSSK